MNTRAILAREGYVECVAGVFVKEHQSAGVIDFADVIDVRDPTEVKAHRWMPTPETLTIGRIRRHQGTDAARLG